MKPLLSPGIDHEPHRPDVRAGPGDRPRLSDRGPFHGRAHEARVQPGQSQPIGAGARGRGFPPDRECRAILRYLADKGAGSPAYPQGPERARPRQRDDGLVQFQCVQGLRVRADLSASLPQSQATERRTAGRHAGVGQAEDPELAQDSGRTLDWAEQGVPVRRSSRWPTTWAPR